MIQTPLGLEPLRAFHLKRIFWGSFEWSRLGLGTGKLRRPREISSCRWEKMVPVYLR